jgi:hypothetical protein
MQRENKWQERFDAEYPHPDVRGVFEDGDPYQARRNSIKSFIQSEIDKAIAERDKEIIEKIERLKEEVRNQTGTFKYDDQYDDCINLIK